MSEPDSFKSNPGCVTSNSTVTKLAYARSSPFWIQDAGLPRKIEGYNLSTTLLEFTTDQDAKYYCSRAWITQSIEHFSHRACVVTVESGSTLSVFNVIVFDPPSRMTLTDIIYFASEVRLEFLEITVWNLSREGLVMQDKRS